MDEIKIKVADVGTIRDAACSPENIIPKELRGYEAQRRKSDDGAFSYTGGFCVSVKLIKNGAKPKCMRCWKDSSVLGYPEQITHLNEVLDLVKNEKVNKYFVKYEIYEDLLKVGDGGTIPGLLMDWVEGDTLNKYVCQSSGKSQEQLLSVADKFVKMCHYLNEHKLSHGDLSAVNIIVTDDGELKLIDYDSLYNPGMGVKRQFITGIKDYQHPSRELAKCYEVYTDYFSQHVIYAALLIMALDGSTRPEEKNLKHLLFTESDFKDKKAFRSSYFVKRGYGLNNTALSKELDILSDSLELPMEKVPPLLDICDEAVKPKIRMMWRCNYCGKPFETDTQKRCNDCGSIRGMMSN